MTAAGQWRLVGSAAQARAALDALRTAAPKRRRRQRILRRLERAAAGGCLVAWVLGHGGLALFGAALIGLLWALDTRPVAPPLDAPTLQLLREVLDRLPLDPVAPVRLVASSGADPWLVVSGLSPHAVRVTVQLHRRDDGARVRAHLERHGRPLPVPARRIGPWAPTDGGFVLDAADAPRAPDAEELATLLSALGLGDDAVTLAAPSADPQDASAGEPT